MVARNRVDSAASQRGAVESGETIPRVGGRVPTCGRGEQGRPPVASRGKVQYKCSAPASKRTVRKDLACRACGARTPPLGGEGGRGGKTKK